MILTDLRTDTGCTDNGEEGVGLWPHSHLDTREPLGEFLLILLCRANCVHINLQNTGTDERRQTNRVKRKGGSEEMSKDRKKEKLARKYDIKA